MLVKKKLYIFSYNVSSHTRSSVECLDEMFACIKESQKKEQVCILNNTDFEMSVHQNYIFLV